MKKIDFSALFTLNYGLYTIGSKSGERLNAQIANAVFQITSSPARIAVAINREELTNQFINNSGYLSVGVLDQTAPLSFIGHFGFKSGRDVDKFDSVDYFTTPAGCPCPEQHILASIELRVESVFEIDTHSLFIGEVTHCALHGEGTPMTYSYYREVLCGKTPPTAPSFKSVLKKVLKPEKKEAVLKQYVCDVCGYVYDPAIGDPDSGIAPGTAFAEIPQDWVCPVCGVGKDQFSEQ